ncbi:venom allergen 5-like isoform X1 [Bolinopsis microptera]|uniref:venom allergen 5-like isoform X1 n=1 Tax=Bolinopsis microptera TaxID=2820187 RepID=UPI003078B3B5
MDSSTDYEICAECEKEITDPKKGFHIRGKNPRAIHKACFDGFVCAGCNENIQKGSVSKAQNKRWHQECFTCDKCLKPIDGSFLTKGDQKFDKKCYNQEFGVQCKVCDDYIMGHILKYNGEGYHYGCLKCDYCKKRFHDGAHLSVKGGNFIHNDCKVQKKGATKGDYDAVKANKERIENEGQYEDDNLVEFERECLKEHNKKRADHHVNSLMWSEECAQHARNWVKKLLQQDALIHDTQSGMGENCGYFNSSSAPSKSDTTWAVNVCNMWYNEIEKYDFGVNEYQQRTGHFTQMIWKSTEKMGCAIAKRGTRVYVVANYYPPGNWVGKYRDNVNDV